MEHMMRTTMIKALKEYCDKKRCCRECAYIQDIVFGCDFDRYSDNELMAAVNQIKRDDPLMAEILRA